MAKGNKKSRKRSLMPKRIAGTKLPKRLRKSGAQALRWAASPTGREVIGGLLVALAAGVAGSKKARKALGKTARDAGSNASRVGQGLAGAAADVVRRAIGDSEQPTGASSTSSASRRPRNKPQAPGLAH